MFSEDSKINPPVIAKKKLPIKEFANALALMKKPKPKKQNG